MRVRWLQLVLGFNLLFSPMLHADGARSLPREKMLLLLSGEWVSRALYVATKLEIADALKEGSKSVEELAKLSKTQPESLARLLHMLAGFDIFEEVAPHVFRNTELSKLLIQSNPGSLHGLSLWYGEDIHKAWEGLLPSIQTGKSAFELIFQQPVFSYLKENPERAALFQESMREKSMAVIESSLASYDFNRFKSIYDIGGGYGQFLLALLQKYPAMNATLFELPEVIATLKQRNFSEKNPCSLLAGDFFQSIPRGAEAYLLKSVLHDWDDEQCGKILKNCHEAMDDKSRLLIIEVVLQPNDASIYANCMDILMLAITGGKERSLQSFEQMLERSGFILEKVYPTATEFSILEARKHSEQDRKTKS